MPTGNRLILGTSGNAMLDFQNGIDLGTALRTIQVEGGTSSGHARINGVLSGAGGLNVAGKGASLLELTAANTYTGGTVLTSSTLLVSSDENLGAASGTLTFNGGTLVNTAAFSTGRSMTLNTTNDTFQTDVDLAVNGVISGSGSLSKTGSGALILTGANTYAGGTTITAGTLQVGNGGTTGSISGDVMNNAVLTFNRSDNISYGGIISGTGLLNKEGAGVLALTGDSSGFGGHMFVNDGTFAISGTLGGTLDVLARGRLQSTGTTGTTITAGTIAPGNSIGTLTVNGDYTQLPGSTYEVEVEPGGRSDQIIVKGLADIKGGTVSVIHASGYYAPGSRYTILTADGGLTGRFDTLAQNLPLINLGLVYDPTHVYLDVLRFCAMAGTRNQCTAGNGAESLGPGNPIYSAIVGLPDQDSVRRAFNNLSGEGHASERAAIIEDSRFVREAVSDRVRQAFSADAALAQEMPGQTLQRNPTTGRAFWSRAFGSFGHRNGDGNASRIGRNIGGVFIGGDMLIADKFLIGLAGGYSNASYNVNQLLTSSSDNYHISVYGGTQWGPLGLRLGSAYAWHDLETNRNIAFAGFSDHAKANYTAHTAQVFGEVGYSLPFTIISLEPFGRIAYVNLDANSFQERGGPAALRSKKDNQGTAYTTVGLNAAKVFSSSGRMTTTLRGSLGWRHAFGEMTPISSFALPGGSSFTTAGVPIAGNAVVMVAGMDVSIVKAATFGIYYNGQVLHNIVDNGVRANLSWKF